MNLGIDFGSTYSSFATCNPTTKQVELCKPTHSESEAVPSVACLDENDNIITGHEARAEIIEDADTVSFDAFKMLLTETEEDVLGQRGYDKTTYTPRYITELFLDQQIQKILTGRSEEKVDSLVACVPEVWTTKEAAGHGMLDGRNILLDILKRISGEGTDVQVVSEPAAASAYFAKYYQTLTGETVGGRVLIIDYGGGTLDLTLTQVNSDSQGAVEIEVKNRTGVGENHPGKIGDAGIAYMEEVVRLAVAESDSVPLVTDGDAINPKDPNFRKAYNNLERKLKGQALRGGPRAQDGEIYRLCDAVQDCIDDISQLEDNRDVFTTFRFGKARVDVTFSHLMRAYNKIIRSRLQECLESMTEYMTDAGIDYSSSRSDRFHIILVGGFGKFILVQNQVQEFFDASSTGDRRFEYDLGENREFAVAMGAALLADKIITIKHTAPYGIGIVSSVDGQKVHNYAIRYRQEISADTSYWIMNQDVPKLFIKSGSLTNFLIGYDIKGSEFHEMDLKDDLIEEINRSFEKLIQGNREKFPEYSKLFLEFNMGFRMDDSEIVTLLLRAVRTGAVEEIPLRSYQEMFELTEG